jgi:hypothetical protein
MRPPIVKTPFHVDFPSQDRSVDWPRSRIVNYPSNAPAVSLGGQHFASDNYAGICQQALDYLIECNRSGHDNAVFAELPPTCVP